MLKGLLHLRWGKNLKIPVLGPDDAEGFADLYRHPGILDFSRTLTGFKPEMRAGCAVTPVPLTHSKPTFGYLFETIEQRIAYLTDTVGLPADTTAFLQGNPLDWLHLSQPKKTVLTHVGHHLDAWFMEGHWSLPDGVVTAHDGMALGAQP